MVVQSLISDKIKMMNGMKSVRKRMKYYNEFIEYQILANSNTCDR